MAGAAMPSSEFVFPLGVEKLAGAVAIGFRHEDLGGWLKSPSSGAVASTKFCVAAMPCFSSIITSSSALTTGPV